MGKALIVSAGNNANEYLARHIGELGYTRPTIVASGGEARRRMDTNDYEVIIINTPLPDEFGHELGTDAVQKTDAGVILLAKTGTAEQIADKLQDFGVLVLGKPFTAVQFRQAVQIAASNYKRLAVLRAENAKLLDKIAQLRLVEIPDGVLRESIRCKFSRSRRTDSLLLKSHFLHRILLQVQARHLHPQ